MVDATVWLYWLGGQVLGGAGVSLALWGLLGDRLLRGHTKRRCPTCWHDLSAMPGLRCPECGKVARSERHVFRSRRRWTPAAAGMLLVVVGTGTIATPVLRTGGWMSIVPLPVRALLWPLVPAFREPSTQVQLYSEGRGRWSRLALNWSTKWVFTHDPGSSDAAQALVMLAAARVATPSADAQALSSLKGPGGPRALVPGITLQAASVSYLVRSRPITQFFSVIEPFAESVDSDARGYAAREMADAIVDDPSVTEPALLFVLSREKTEWARSLAGVLPMGGNPSWMSAGIDALSAVAARDLTPHEWECFAVIAASGHRNWAEAINALGSLDNVRPLIGVLERAPETILEPFRSLLQDVSMKGTDEALVSALRNAQRPTAAWLINMLAENCDSGQHPLSDEAVVLMIKALRDPNLSLAYAAKGALCYTPESSAARLIELLDDPEARVREFAIDILPRLRPCPHAAYERLIRISVDPSEFQRVRVHAREAAEYLKPPEPRR